MLSIFIGVDVRQPVAFTTLQMSIISRSSKPVAITPLLIDQLPVKRRGLTDFTYTRYLPPFLMGYQGWALFADADMLVRGDVADLFALADDRYAVQVVKTGQRFEWPSMMLFNCAKCMALTPNFIESGRPQDMQWGEVGELPAEWNYCIGYDAPRDDAKLLHYTMGVPAFPEVEILGHVDEWRQDLRAACSTVPWLDLMGGSVHAQALEAIRAKSRESVGS